MDLNIDKICSIEEYTDGNIEKTALASSAFVNGAVGLFSFSKNKLNNIDNNALEGLKNEIANNNNTESELTTSLYNGFYLEDKRKVL